MSALSRLATYLSWVPVAVVVYDRVGTVHCVRDVDMQPAVGRNTLCVLRRVRPSSLAHGEVVAVMTADGSRTVLRRLVALPGDYVVPRRAARSASPLPSGSGGGGDGIDAGGEGVVGIGGEMEKKAQGRYVPPGFVWVETDVYQSDALCEGKVPLGVIRGRVTRILPSLQTIPNLPSDRAFPSNNKQLYLASRHPSG